MSTTQVERLPVEVWRAREQAHADRADALTAGHRERAARHEKHPVVDFLFTYYRLRPGLLRRWHPGPGVALVGDDPAVRGSWRHYRCTDGAVSLDVDAFVAARGAAVAHVRRLLAATASRPAALGCFGMHEWAMVHGLGADDVRHAGWPLRSSPAETDAVVEAQRLRCTHYDAVRFFTPSAAPRNELDPRPDDRVAFEQPGCLHASMDLYKWCVKLGPAAPGDLTLDAFELALAARELDMAASPYDVSGLGYEPVPVETPAGRAEYVSRQRALAERAAPLRARIVGVCDELLAQVTTATP